MFNVFKNSCTFMCNNEVCYFTFQMSLILFQGKSHWFFHIFFQKYREFYLINKQSLFKITSCMLSYWLTPFNDMTIVSTQFFLLFNVFTS